MDEIMYSELPPVELYSIDPEHAGRLAPLLTPEALTQIQNHGAFGLAIGEDQLICGAICGRYAPGNEQILQIISFYVDPEHRRRQLGSTLLMEYLEAFQRSCDFTLRRVELSFTPDTGLEQFLEKLGFVCEAGEEFSSVLTAAQLSDSPLAKLPGDIPEGCRLLTLDQIPDFQLMGELREHGADYIDNKTLNESRMDVSFVLVDEENVPVACSVLHETEQGKLCLSQFYTAHFTPQESIAVLSASLKAVVEKEPPDTELEIPIVMNSVSRLAARLLGTTGEKRSLIYASMEL